MLSEVAFYLKYRGLILQATWPALGSDDLNLDQSGMSIQILPEPNAGHVTHFFYKITTLIHSTGSTVHTLPVDLFGVIGHFA